MLEQPAGDGLEMLDADDCRARLTGQYVGRVGYVHEGRPVIVPVNYRVAEDGAVVLLSAEGAKLEVARAGGLMCLQVDGSDDVYKSGWCVLLTGHASVVDDPGALAEARELALRPWARGASRTHLIRIAPDRIEGRRLR